MVKFSIIIPIIKKKFLEDAINSVVNQTFFDWELVLYNDCSSDEIDFIIDKYKDNRKIKYVKGEKNLGANDPSKAWNKALEFASGDYICLLGDDDLLADNFLEEMKRIIDKYPTNSIFRSKLKRIDEEGNVFMENINLPEFESWIVFFYRRLVGKRIQSTSEFVLRKLDLLNIGGYVSFLRACGSDDATYLLLSKKNGVISTNKTFACWRKNSLNISDNDSEHLNRKKLKKLLIWERDFLDKNLSSEVSVWKMYSAISNLLLECDYVICDCKPSFFEGNIFLRKIKLFFLKYWYTFLNSPLRQPARKVWYFIRGKKIIN